MQTAWIIENDTFEEQKALETALTEQGIPFFNVNYTPVLTKPPKLFTPKLSKVTELSQDDCIVFYGCVSMTRALLSSNPWTKTPWFPTAWMNLPNLSCKTYRTQWKNHLAVTKGFFTTWGLLRYQYRQFYGMFNYAESIFVKPNENLKLFSGKAVAKDEFEKWAKQEEDCYGVSPEVLCLVTEAVRMQEEWRFVICNKKVISGSIYKSNGPRYDCDDHFRKAWEAAEKLANDPWQPDSVYVADIARVGRRYGLLEIGSINCCALYNCDLKAVTKAVTEQALKEYAEYASI